MSVSKLDFLTSASACLQIFSYLVFCIAGKKLTSMFSSHLFKEMNSFHFFQHFYWRFSIFNRKRIPSVLNF